MTEYRQVEGFPDYAVSNDGKVRNLATGAYSRVVRVSKRGGHIINLIKDGKTYSRAIEQLQLDAFGEEFGVAERQINPQQADKDNHNLEMLIRELRIRFGRLPDEDEVYIFINGTDQERDELWTNRGKKVTT